MRPESLEFGRGKKSAKGHSSRFAFPGAERFIPEEARHSLRRLREASKSCRGCDLCEVGTQTVFGEGAADARMVFVGEQPGNQEDLAGKPFVGPAGHLLDRALAEAGIDRSNVYVTNAVKHFKFKRQGKIRLHQRPGAGEVSACRPWLKAELELIRPDLLICLGLTAAQSVLGKAVTLKSVEGRVLKTGLCEKTLVLTHPSALLRIPDAKAKAVAYRAYVSQLRRIAKMMPSQNWQSN